MGTAAVFQLAIRVRRLFIAARFEANDQPGDSSAAKPYDWVFFAMILVCLPILSP
jgi:hypothetical protein